VRFEGVVLAKEQSRTSLLKSWFGTFEVIEL